MYSEVSLMHHITESGNSACFFFIDWNNINITMPISGNKCLLTTKAFNRNFVSNILQVNDVSLDYNYVYDATMLS